MWPAGWRRPSRSASGVLCTAALALLVSACNPSSDSGRLAASGRHRFDSNGGRYAVDLETTPVAIAVNQPFDVIVTVTPKSSIAKDLVVQVDARMPAHFHGMNRVARVTRAGASWKAEGLVFHMPGHWELYIDVTEGGVTERAQLDVDLK